VAKKIGWAALALVAVAAAIALGRGGLTTGPSPADEAEIRRTLFDELQPVTLKNCTMQRFGEPNDGGYLLCANLLDAVESAYSYGIGGYDGWGCDVSTALKVPVHRYDCFDPADPPCPSGQPMFHPECVGTGPATIGGRLFDSMTNQIAANGDAGKRLVLKIDVEGAEWDAFLETPSEVLARIDQLAVEFHRVEGERSLKVVRKLKEIFHVANLHFNNHACQPGLEPFPSWAFEVLFVSKRLGEVDAAVPAPVPNPLDTPSSATMPDCQAVTTR
jgi:hypothetical protein